MQEINRYLLTIVPLNDWYTAAMDLLVSCMLKKMAELTTLYVFRMGFPASLLENVEFETYVQYIEHIIAFQNKFPSSQVPKFPSSQVPKFPSSQVPKLPISQVPNFPSSKAPNFPSF